MLITPGRAVAAALLLVVAGCDDASTAKPSPVAAKSTPATAAKWLETTAATPEGGFRIGNPNARVKLLEYASLTCPHCKDFHAEAMGTIKSKYIASGDVSYEFRNFVLNGPDLAASVLARCQGPQPFFGLLNAFFTDQASWTKPFTELAPADQTRIAALPQDQQLAAIAEAGKLDSYVRARGIPRGRFDACFADKSQVEKLTAMGKTATETYKLTGTPGFIINGKTQEGVYNWATLEPKLQAALQ